MVAKTNFDSTSLGSLGCHLIYGEIDQSSAKDTCEFILKSNLMGAEQATIFLNSEGGNCTDGFAIIDCMEASRIPVHTIAIGMSMSMGVLIMSAGNKGTRTITKNTEVMAHQFSGYFEGKQHELLATQKSLVLLEERFYKHFLTHSKMTQKQIKDVLFAPSDRYLTPAECKKYGLVDKVVDSLASTATSGAK